MSTLNINTSRSTNTTPLITPSLTQYVPREIWQKICSYLDTFQDISRIGRTTPHLYVQIFSNPLIWDSILQKHFPDSCVNSQSEATGLALCHHLTNIDKNRKIGRYRSHTIAGSEVRGIFKNLLSKDQLIFGLTNGDIQIFDLKSRKELQTLKGHQSFVTKILVNENQLISISIDGTIKIWDLKKGKELQTIESHYNGITDILVHKDRVISASDDFTIKIWDLNDGREVDTLAGHLNQITDILLHGNNLISASLDSTIKIWDLNSRQEIQTLEGHQAGIRDISVHENNLISASCDSTTKIWNLKRGEAVHTLAGNQYSRDIYNNKLILVVSNRTIKILDLQSGRELHTIESHQDFVDNVLIHDNLLFVTSCTSKGLDSVIQIWDMKSGKEVQTLKNTQGLVDNFLIYKNQLIFHSGYATKIYDFSFPPLSPYSKQVLEESLSILGEMAHAERIQHLDRVEELAQTLDPDFKQRLKQHAFNVDAPSTYSASVILRVQTEICVEALLHAIYDEDQTRVSQLLDQLLSINSQNAEIYRLLWKVCGGDKSVKWGGREFAFHNKEEYTASLSEKEEATVLFKKELKKRWGKDVPLLLLDLGIKANECSLKLNWGPNHLKKVGIRSVNDLKALGVLTSPQPGIHTLKITVEDVSQDRNQLQKRAHDKEKTVSVLLLNLSKAVDERISETAQCSALLYDRECPWTAFKQELNDYKAIFAALEKECKDPKILLEKFEPTAYAEIIEKVNCLINGFHILDKEHQIAKLRGYVTQVHLLGAWNNLRRQDIDSLATLLERTDIPRRDLFQMGE
jgi:WD40 repeat protein